MSSHHSSSSSSSSGYKFNSESRSSTSRSSFSHGDNFPADHESRRKMFDRHFSSAGIAGAGIGDDDFRSPLFRDRPFFSTSPLWPRRRLGSGSGEEIRLTADRFRLLLDVALYEADDLSVVATTTHVTVSGRHDERSPPAGGLDSSSSVAAARQFRHSYALPEDAPSDLITSSVTRDGILIVEGPRRPTPGPSRAGERVVSISTVDPDGLSPDGARGEAKS